MKDIIRELAALFAPPGSEQKVRDYCSAKANGFEITTDGCGNLMLHRPGVGKRVAFLCGMDEKGIFLSHKEQDGRFRFCVLGGSCGEELNNRRVCFENGAQGVIQSDQEKPELNQLWLSILQGEAFVGDSGVITGECQQTEKELTACGAGRGACCTALLSLTERQFQYGDLWFVFSSLYQMGKKGALVALSQIRPELAFLVEPVSVDQRDESSKVILGKGAAVKLRDGAFMDYFHLADVLQNCKIAHQFYVSSKPEIPGKPPMIFGIPSVLLGIPYKGEGYFMQKICYDDVKSTIDLLFELAVRL